MKNFYDYQVLLDMAQSYLEAEREYRVFLHSLPGGRVRSGDVVEYGRYVEKASASQYTLYALRDACKLVSVNMAAVLATAKAMNRYEKRERWQVCARVGWRAEDELRRFWEAE